MKKENIGRMLLTLLTAFVMVAGVFGAAVQTSDISETVEEANQSSAVALSELGMKMDETGEAPVSVISNAGGAGSDGPSVTDFSELSEPETPSSILLDLGDLDDGIDVEMSSEDSTILGSAPLDQGTRAATVDAGGPYGEKPPGSPYYEGDTVNFDATISGGLKDDYKFRWDVDNDAVFDGPGAAPDYWGAKGESAYTQDFKDNHIGDAKVEAWDGTMSTVTGGGDIWNGNTANNYYMGGYRYVTVGLKFEAHREVTIDELGVYRYGSYAYTYYNLRLWDASSQTLLRSVNYPSIPYYVWTWFNIAPITIPAGEYVVSVGIYYYYQIGTFNPGMTSDGVIEPLNWCRASGQYSYPSQDLSANILPKLDINYEYTYQVPNLIEGVADVWVDNRAPVAINPQVIGEPGQEGTEIGFTGALLDAGLDDDWQYRWDFGDGTDSGWLNVLKWQGGAKVLLYHSIAGYETATAAAIQAAMGNWARVLDIWSFYNDPGTLEMLLEYDVVIFPENTGIIGGWPTDVGDLLADYVDAGGAVVDMVPTFMNGGTWGITGRWADEGYSAFNLAPSYGGSQSTNTIYDPSHPIIDGPAGTVSKFGTSIPCHISGITPGSTLLADYPSWRAAAYKEAGAMGPGSGRVVSLNIFILPGYTSGDAMMVTANAAIWASQAIPPGPIPMPIPLETIYHIYKDDHPTTLTPSDVIDVKLEVKDDDHLRVFGGAGADWNGPNLALTGTASHSGGGSGVWGPQRLNNGDKVGTYNDCWTAYGGGSNWNEIEWTTPQTIGGSISYYTRYRNLQGYCMHSADIEYWDGSSFKLLQHYDDLDHGNHKIDAVIPFDATVSTTRIRMSNMLTYTTNGNIMIQEWELFPPGIGGDPYEMFGLGEAFTTVTIENVFPGAINPLGVVLDMAENTPILYEGFEITDNALGQPTENFYYRWDFDDGTGISPWTPAIVKAPTSLDVLLVQWLDLSYGGTNARPLLEALNNAPIVSRFEEYNIYVENAAPDLAYMEEFDVVIWVNVYRFYAGWDQIELLGDRLADFQDNTGGGVITMMCTYAGPLFSLFGRYIDDNYGPFEKAPSYNFGNTNLGTIYNPTHPIMSGVTDVESSAISSGNMPLVPGAELLADWQTGAPAIGAIDKPGSGRSVHIGMMYYYGLNPVHDDLLLDNAMRWVGTKFSPVTDTMPHNFMDNGIYYVDLQIVDDDMLWDFTPTGPVFTGAPADPMAWMSHNIFPTSIDNSDPVISPKIRAYGELDLSLRMSGNKDNTATMRLETFQNGVLIGTQEVTVYRDPGSPDIGVLSAIIEMTGDYSYNLEIEYDPNDLGGANPTWIFEGHFPDGKIKELKHTFNSNDPTDRVWSIGNVKQLLLGHDIIFEAEASDDGSDDLAFVWSWGDQTPQGVHIFANADPSVLDGVTDVANEIFDQDPDRDPWFERTPNSERSPDGGPITIRDSISHVFDESQPAYIYVTLTVIDDDVYDGYPSTFLNGGGYDMEFAELDFR